MHLHGFNMYVLHEGDGDWDGTIVNPGNPQRRDVVQLRKNGHLMMQFDAGDNPGVRRGRGPRAAHAAAQRRGRDVPSVGPVDKHQNPRPDRQRPMRGVPSVPGPDTMGKPILLPTFFPSWTSFLYMDWLQKRFSSHLVFDFLFGCCGPGHGGVGLFAWTSDVI